MNLSPKLWEGDPYKLHLYTLANGLKLYLRENHSQPKIEARIVVRAGSLSDPDSATGVAHLLEHMMFKGTSKIGALDQNRDYQTIKSIKSLYEELRHGRKKGGKGSNYEEIDKLSLESRQYAIPGEFDRIYTLLGAEGVNAYTDFEETVYSANIPSSELESWIRLERERFRKPRFRFFPTELLAIYEEFNQDIDDDFSLAYNSLLSLLFGGTLYAKSGVIGKAKDLTVPSLEKLEWFFENYYCADNMAICLSGDLNPQLCAELIAQFWNDFPGGYSKKEKKRVNYRAKRERVVKRVGGPEPSFVVAGYTLPGIESELADYLPLFDMIMNNNQAGLIDTGITHPQKLPEAGSFVTSCSQNSWLVLHGTPGKRTSLERAGEQLISQVERFKRGRWPSRLLTATIENLESDQEEELEGNSVVDTFSDAFIGNIEWERVLNLHRRWRSIEKRELVGALSSWLKNPVFVYKEQTEQVSRSGKRIKSPPLTPLPTKREERSNFFNEFSPKTASQTAPLFKPLAEQVDERILFQKRVSRVQNSRNNFFEFYTIFDVGRNHLPELPLLASLFPLFSTTSHSYTQREQRLFFEGVEFGLECQAESSILYLKGRSHHFQTAISEVKQLLKSGFLKEKELQNFKKSRIKQLGDIRYNRSFLLYELLYSYGKYREEAPLFRDPCYKKGYIKSLESEQPRALLKELFESPRSFYCYGDIDWSEIEAAVGDIEEIAGIAGNVEKQRRVSNPKEVQLSSDQIIFLEYPITQFEGMILSAKGECDKTMALYQELFNSYYGDGMDSILCQKLREEQGLVYSVSGELALPESIGKTCYLEVTFNTASATLSSLLKQLQRLLREFSSSETQFESVKSLLLKRAKSDIVQERDLFWVLRELNRFGVTEEFIKESYKKVESVTLSDLNLFFNERVSPGASNLLLVGRSRNLKSREISQLGEIEIIDPEELLSFW